MPFELIGGTTDGNSLNKFGLEIHSLRQIFESWPFRSDTILYSTRMRLYVRPNISKIKSHEAAHMIAQNIVTVPSQSNTPSQR